MHETRTSHRKHCISWTLNLAETQLYLEFSLGVLDVRRIVGSLSLGVEGSQELFRRRAQRQQRDWIGPVRKLYIAKLQRESKCQGCLAPGLGVERNAKGSLLSTSEAVRKCMRLGAMFCARQRGILIAQLDDPVKPMVSRICSLHLRKLPSILPFLPRVDIGMHMQFQGVEGSKDFRSLTNVEHLGERCYESTLRKTQGLPQ
jgi:hypothetical protein